MRLAYCWSHVRRGFFEIAASRPVAAEALVRIARLYAIEQDIRGHDPDTRRAARLEQSAPIRQHMVDVDGEEPIGGPGTAVEVDETLMGGVQRGKHMRGSAGKTVIVGALERGGDIITQVVPNQRRVTLKPFVVANVQPGGQLHTGSYEGLHLAGYRHMTVTASVIFVRRPVRKLKGSVKSAQIVRNWSRSPSTTECPSTFECPAIK